TMRPPLATAPVAVDKSKVGLVKPAKAALAKTLIANRIRLRGFMDGQDCQPDISPAQQSLPPPLSPSQQKNEIWPKNTSAEGLLEVELLHAVPQGAPGYPQQPGGRALIAARALDGGHQQGAFHGLQRKAALREVDPELAGRRHADRGRLGTAGGREADV